MPGGFEWDPKKNTTNIAKHGIDFDDAIGVFDGPALEQELPQRQGDEQRLLAIGMVDAKVTAVIYTLRGGSRRIISARSASRRERAAYRETFPPGPQRQDRLGPG